MMPLLRRISILLTLAAGPAARAADQAPSAPSPDGKLVAVADGKAVVLRDAASGKDLRKVLAHKNDVSAVAFAPDGRVIASADKAGLVVTFEAATGKQIWHHHGKVAVVR